MPASATQGGLKNTGQKQIAVKPATPGGRLNNGRK